MGRVFSYETVMSGGVPSLADFSRATDLFCDGVEAGIDDGVFDAGLVFGSVARGTPNMRSDFDSLIALSDDSTRSYQAARELSQGITQECANKIAVEPITYTQGSLVRGDHEINQLFGQHLLGDNCLTIGPSPADYLVFQSMSPHHIASHYFYQKIRSLSDLYISVTDLTGVNNSSLQRTLELPSSVSRNVTKALGAIGTLLEVCDASDKTGIFDVTNDLFEEFGLHEDFSFLCVLNSEYTELLEATLNGKITKSTYDAMLIDIHGEIPRAVNWTRAVARTILPILERITMTDKEPKQQKSPIEYPYMPEQGTIVYDTMENPVMQFAKEFAKRNSLDKSIPNTSVVVKDGEILGAGANGSNFHDENGCERVRQGIPTGQGYELCEGCHPKNHGEQTAIADATELHDTADVQGAEIYLWGHWWCCESCWDAMLASGIHTVHLLEDSETLFNRESPDNIIGKQFES